MRALSLVVGVSTCLLAASACSSGPPEDTATTNGGALVASNVFVIDALPSSVEKDRLSFAPEVGSTITDRRPGDILVSGHGSGFLRQVVAIERGATSVDVVTRQASLSQVFQRAHLHTRPSASQPRPLDESTVSGPSINGLSLKVGDTTVVDDADVRVSVTEADFDFSAGLDFGLDVEGGQTDLRLVAEGSFDARVRGKLETQGSASVSSKVINWGDQLAPLESLTPTTITVWADVVPIVIVVRVEVYASAGLSLDGKASLDCGASASSSLRLGIACSASGCSPVGDHSFRASFDPIEGSAEGTAKVTLGLVTKLSFSLYDVAGPFVTVQPYVGDAFGASGGGSVTQTGLLGVKSTAGGEVTLFDSTAAGFQGTLFDWSTTFDPSGVGTGGDAGGLGGDAGVGAFDGGGDASSYDGGGWGEAGYGDGSDGGFVGDGGWIDEGG